MGLLSARGLDQLSLLASLTELLREVVEADERHCLNVFLTLCKASVKKAEFADASPVWEQLQLWLERESCADGNQDHDSASLCRSHVLNAIQVLGALFAVGQIHGDLAHRRDSDALSDVAVMRSQFAFQFGAA